MREIFFLVKSSESTYQKIIRNVYLALWVIFIWKFDIVIIGIQNLASFTYELIVEGRLDDRLRVLRAAPLLINYPTPQPEPAAYHGADGSNKRGNILQIHDDLAFR